MEYPCDQFLLLYGTCIPVKGFSRSIIYDLQFRKFKFITNDLYDLLISLPLTIDRIKEIYGEGNHETIIEYVDFLFANKFCFFVKEEELNFFQKINIEYDSPAKITNAIIDENITSKHNFKVIFEKLCSLGCRDFQLRFFHNVIVSEVLKKIEDSLNIKFDQ